MTYIRLAMMGTPSRYSRAEVFGPPCGWFHNQKFDFCCPKKWRPFELFGRNLVA